MKALVVASGPSLTQEQIDYAKDKVDLSIAVNDAIYLMPWADILYSGDNRWWNHHGPELTWYEGERLCAARDNKYSTMIQGVGGRGGFLKDRVRFGGNSGFAALNLALLRGGTQIILLGFDLGHEEEGAKHFFGEHPENLNVESPYARWREDFIIAAPSIVEFNAKVINCTEGGYLNCFPKAKITEVL